MVIHVYTARDIRRVSWPVVLMWIVGAVVAVAWAAPFVWMISTSLKPVGEVMTRQVEWLPRHVTLDNYAKVLEKPVLRWLLNSLLVSFVSTGVSLLTGAMAGYALARMNFPGRNIFFFLVLAALMIPTEMTIVPLFIGALRAGIKPHPPAACSPATKMSKARKLHTAYNI